MLSREVRIKFSKTGKVKYISHLDLCRTMRTAFVRAGIPIWYSQGFNPHPKMVFATTVAVGSESLCELLDIRITREMGEEDFRARLAGALTRDIDIKEVYEPVRPLSELQYSSYRITFDRPVNNGVLSQLLQGELKVMKKTKSGDRLIDILPMIKQARAEDNILYCTLASSQTMSLGPDVFIRGIAPACEGGEALSILRTGVFDAGLDPFR